jgi:hypothetical protein
MADKFNRADDKVPATKKKVFKLEATSTFDSPNTKPLRGYWINCDAETRGVEALAIGARKGKLSVRAWGSCSPTWCVWGSAKPARAYSESVSSGTAVALTAEWDFGFSEVLMTGTFCGGCLHIQTFTHFKDGSKRYDYHSSVCFYRVDYATWKKKTKGKI